MTDFSCPRRAVLAGFTLLLAGCGSDQEPAPVDSAGSLNVSDVPVGGGVVTADGMLVLQLTEGEFTAFSAVCPHQNWRVSPPDGEGVITCGAHQSHFRANDGERIDGPAPSGLNPIAIKVVNGQITRA